MEINTIGSAITCSCQARAQHIETRNTGNNTVQKAGSPVQTPQAKPSNPVRSQQSHHLNTIIDTPKLRESLREAFRQVIKPYQAISSFTRQAAKEDRAQGIGLRQGLQNLQNRQRSYQFVQRLNRAVRDPENQATSAAKSTGSKPPQASADYNQASLWEQVGSLAESYTLNTVQRQTALYVAEQMGIDTSGLTTTALVENIIGRFSGSSGTASASAASGAAAASEGAEASSAAGSTIGSTAGNVMGAVGAAYSAYQMIDNWGQSNPAVGAVQGATIGGYIGSCFLPGVGTAVGAVLGGAIGACLGMVSSGKHEHQQLRDAVRSHLQDIGLIDEKYCLELADGSKYDIGLDGGHRYQNTDGSERRAHDVDHSHPLAAEAIAWAQPLAAVLVGGDLKPGTNFTGYFVNAALSNATDIETVRQNVHAIYEKMNVPPEQILGALTAFYEQGKIDQEHYVAFVEGFQGLVNGTTAGGTPTEQYGIRLEQAA